LHTGRFCSVSLEIPKRNAEACEVPAGFILTEEQSGSELLLVLGLATPSGRCRLTTGGRMYGQAGCPNRGVFSFSEADD